MEQRLAKLKQADYISWPDLEQRKYQPIPEPICWLGWRGALFIADSFGEKVEPPKNDNEYQLRALQKRLRDVGIRWVRRPNWIQLRHDLAVVDFRLAIEKSISQISTLDLLKWISEGEFRVRPDEVVFSIIDTQGVVWERKKNIIPDGYFEIEDEELKAQGLGSVGRFLLELDMATHDNPSFGREKVVPGFEYIGNDAYRKRFGSAYGRWLVVTKGGKTRMENLMKQVKEYAIENPEYFFFTTFDQVINGNIFSEPIWWLVGTDHSVSLLD
jgi:hypothetical protein